MSTSAPAASAVEATYCVLPGLYLLGTLEKGLTVHSQQLRAHNLVWAIWERLRQGPVVPNENLRIAIVGGGIAGLTAAACCLARFETASITLFEELWDLCPLQQGTDTRWLHPRIYEWPSEGSRAPEASLPVLNWSEGRASDVARNIIRGFSHYCQKFDADGRRLKVLLGVGHLRIEALQRRIEWIANLATRAGAFFHIGPSEGSAASFDVIIVAAGFGLETIVDRYPTESYWRNEQIGQPIQDGTRRNYIVSGFGDGALVDVCRLTIERFRQDTVLYELFGRDLERVEQELAAEWLPRGRHPNAYPLLKRAEQSFAGAKGKLTSRIRKDTRVLLHIAGKNNEVKQFSDIFGNTSSFLNRLLMFLLYRCGAFSISLVNLEAAAKRHGTSPGNILCRYGADPIAHLSALFVDFDSIKDRLSEIRTAQKQEPRELWKTGTFPTLSGGYQ